MWIEQDLINLRFDQGVIWFDNNQRKKTGIYHLLIYAEGNVYAEAGAKNTKGKNALLELKTQARSGAVKFKPASGVILKSFSTQDPLYQRGLKELISVNSSSIGFAPLPITGNNEADPNSQNQVVPANQFSTDGNNKNPLQLTGGQPPIPEIPGNAQIPIPQPPGAPPPDLQVPNQGMVVPPAPPHPPERTITISPRSSFQGIQFQNFPNTTTGETAIVFSSGIILNVTNADGKGGVLDIEADRLVFWTTGNTEEIIQDLRSSKGQKHRSLEFYMSGNVEIRTKNEKESRLLRADEVYYDVNRHVAVASHADLEFEDPRISRPLHLIADELFQINQNLFEADEAQVNASELPYDPGLSLTVRNATLETKQIIRKTIFGNPIIDRNTGQPVQDVQRYFRGRNVFVWLEDIPVFYFPFVQGDAEDPLGPLENLGFSFNQIFGFQVYTTWDVYDLIGVTAAPGTRWHLMVDGLTDRGPALGTEYSTQGIDLFGIPNRYTGSIRAWGLYDGGFDVIGGGRGTRILVSNDPFVRVPIQNPEWRGRFQGRLNVQDLPYGFTVQTQVAAISDLNFLEQYFYREWHNEPNQETFFYAKQQQGNWAWTGIVEPRIRRWITETERLPEFQGHLIGLKFFDLFTYNLRASAGYNELEVTEEPAFAFAPTDFDAETGRFDLFQEISAPFAAGPFKLIPYAKLDLAYYTEDVTGNDRGRVYGGGGLRASIPFSRLYPDAYSEFFNLNGIYHKIVFTGNYYQAFSDTAFTQYPQLDRFNDDTSDQALRNIRPNYERLYPDIFPVLLSDRFDPQRYAIRDLIFSNIDTLDDIEVIQLGVRQRWQTKRGFPGREHIIDWMTLNLTGSIFPRQDRDNFGNALAFLRYDWTWNIGDRTSLVSTGWFDPIETGARAYEIGAYQNRPDNSYFYLGYRQIDPLESKSVIGSLTYVFSRKYSMTVSANYDFGIQNQVTTFLLSRNGKDLRVSLGVNYNSILNNWGLLVEIVPNLAPSLIRSPGTTGLLGNTGIGSR